MNIIIVGCGKVGQTLAERLSREEGHNVTVVDTKSSIIRELTGALDIIGVEGSGASLETLLEAGVKDADILIAVTDSDEINLLTCFIAKKSGDCGTIARVRKPEYGRELILFKEDLGLAMIINPEQAAAAEIARALRFPSAIQIDTFAKGRVEILKFRVSDDSILSGLSLAELRPKLGCNVLVCGVERGDEVFIPGGDFVIRSGDRLSFVSEIKSGTAFFKKIGIKTNKVRNAIIVGGSDTAFYLAKLLIQSGISVKIIEKDTARCEFLCQKLPKAVIVNGDGSDSSVLLEEGIESAESFVALTNIDEENILISLYARSRTKGKIITKINRIAFDDVINGLDLDTTICPKNITAENIVKFVRAKNNSIGSNIETMHMILGDKAEALEFRIREKTPLVGVPLEKLRLKDNTLIACINRGGTIINPCGKDTMEVGDTVIVVTAKIGFKDIRDILL